MRNDELRKKGIGGSEIAAVCGLNPWTSPQEVWERKVTIMEERPQTRHMKRGTFLEPALLRWLADDLAIEIRSPVDTMQSREHPLVIATPDGLTADAVAEVKAPDWRTAQHWDDPADVPDGIPDYYLTQVMWEMAAAELGKALVGALINGDLQIYRVDFSQALFNTLLERAKEFWRYVELRETPPIQDVQGARWIADFKKQASPDLVELEAGSEIERRIGRLVTEYKDIKAGVNEAEERADLLKGHICEAIGDRAGLMGNGWRVTWKTDKSRPVINWEYVAHAAGATDEQIKQFTIKRPGSRRFLTKITGGK